MYPISNQTRFFLYSEPTDMRKSFYGLCGIISNELAANDISYVKSMENEQTAILFYEEFLHKNSLLKEQNIFSKYQIGYLKHQINELKRMIFGEKENYLFRSRII